MSQHRPRNLQEAIELRAYEIWENAGRLNGQALDNWLVAETEIDPIEEVTWAPPVLRPPMGKLIKKSA